VGIKQGLYFCAEDYVRAVHPAPARGRTNKYKPTASGRPTGSKDASGFYGDYLNG